MPGECGCGSLMVEGSASVLPRVRYHLDVHIEDGFARTTVDQVYYNTTSRQLEGKYRFPLPAGASISRLAMEVKGELMEGGMVKKERATEVFETIRRTRRDPVLLELVDGQTFQMRVFPVEPHEHKRIILSYTQRLDEEDGQWIYRFPGADVQEVSEWSATVRVCDAYWSGWECETHDFEKGAAREDDLVLNADAMGVTPEGAMMLRVDAARRPIEPRFEYMESGGNRYAMLRWRPELHPPSTTRTERSWVVVFEASADRDPVFARQQIESLRELMAAYPLDRFHVIAANTEIVTFHQREDLAKLENLHLIGGLDLERAFEEAADLCRASGDKVIVHLGAGRATLGEREVAQLVQKLPSRVPYLGVGTGRGVNADLMQAAAERSGGLFSTVSGSGEITRMARTLLQRPDGLSVESDEARFLLDSDSVLIGGEIFAVARLAAGDALPQKVRVKAGMNSGTWQREFEPKWRKVSAGYLPRTWARMEIDRLENREEIVALSQEMFVMSPFTSLLVLETAEMHRQYGVDRGRTDQWARYPAAKFENLKKPDWKSPQKPESPKAPSAGGMEEIELTFPKPMFVGTPVRVNVPNMETRSPGGWSVRPQFWRPMFAGESVALARSWRDEPSSYGRVRRSFRAPVGTKLLSLNAAVTSSDPEPIIGELELITDGSKDGADGDYVELGPDLQWVQIDLGARRELWAIALWHFHKNMRAYLDVVVQISDDPEFRTGVRTVFNNDHDNSSRFGIGEDKVWIEDNHGRIMDVPGLAARYVRLYSNGNSANEMNHYVEVEVWGLQHQRAEQKEDKQDADGWEKVAGLEKTIEAEWAVQHAAGAVDLNWLRRSHAEVFVEMSVAIHSGGAVPNDLAGRIVKIADRWWGIDAGSQEACQSAAALFGEIGCSDLRWAYLTTPVALADNPKSAWENVEAFAQRHRDPVLEALARREVVE